MRITITAIGAILLACGALCLWPELSTAQSRDRDRDPPRAERIDRDAPPERVERRDGDRERDGDGDPKKGRRRDPGRDRETAKRTETGSASERQPKSVTAPDIHQAGALTHSDGGAAIAPPPPPLETGPPASHPKAGALKLPRRAETDLPRSSRDAGRFRDRADHAPDRGADLDMEKLDREDRELERKTQELASRYRRASEEQRVIIQKQLTELVEQHFEIRQSLRAQMIKQLEQQLSDLRTSMDNRKAARKSIIQRRISELTNRDGGLDF